MKYEERLCNFCHTSKEDDEFHFIQECPFNDDHRSKLKLYLINCGINFDLKTVMKCNIKGVNFEFAKFIYRSFQKRKQVSSQ